MDSTTATAELGWTVYPVSGTSDNSVSGVLCLHSRLLLIMTIESNSHFCDNAIK